MNPLVSIIIPCYNAENYIAQALESIREQSYTNIEVIVIDDGSSDNSTSICEEFTQADDRFSLLKNTSNNGVAFTLNRGIQQAVGKYIARMDADDISYPNRIERQVELLEDQEEVDIVGVDAIIIDTENKTHNNNNPIYLEFNTLSFSTYFSQPFFGGSLLGREAVFKEIAFKKGFISEDYEFALNAVNKGFKLKNINIKLYGYRKNLSSISNTNHDGQVESHNRSSQFYLELLHKKKLDQKVVAISNNRPVCKISYRLYTSAIALFDQTFKLSGMNYTREIHEYQIRSKIDISIQAIKNGKDISDRIKITYPLFRLIATKIGLKYTYRKFI
jgi:glycosyltransferase involved in cell wall biosynthesis